MVARATLFSRNMPTVIASQKVHPDRLPEYHRAQRKLNELVQRQPGFSGTEIIAPVEGLQEDWVAVFRFDSNENLQKWLHLPERVRLVEELNAALSEPPAYQVVADNETVAKPATAVFSHRIRPGREEDFADWKRRIIRARIRQPGHLGSEMFAPVPGVQDGWVDIVRFDCPENLEKWLKSPERRRLIEEALEFSESIEARPLATGLENWFRLAGTTGGEEGNVPIWKQSLLVLLALYPTIMIMGFVTAPLARVLPHPVYILVGNMIGVAVLAWILMPRLSRWMAFFLHPAPVRPRWKTDLAGIGVVCGVLLLFLSGFLLFF